MESEWCSDTHVHHSISYKMTIYFDMLGPVVEHRIASYKNGCPIIIMHGHRTMNDDQNQVQTSGILSTSFSKCSLRPRHYIWRQHSAFNFSKLQDYLPHTYSMLARIFCPLSLAYPKSEQVPIIRCPCFLYSDLSLMNS